jgi:hypothetical protein
LILPWANELAGIASDRASATSVRFITNLTKWGWTIIRGIYGS